MRKRDFINLQTNNLIRRYQNLFKNELEFEGLEYGVADYLMNKLLTTGTVAAFNLLGAEFVKQLAFGAYVGNDYDWKGDPLRVRIINERNNALVPKKDLVNNVEVVLFDLGFIPNDYISEYVYKIEEVRKVIKLNLNNHKMPFVVKSGNVKDLKAIQELLDGEEIVYVSDLEFEVVNANTPYIIDKLTLYISELEAELLSVIGIDNIKFEKKAQMTVDEVNSNEDEIDSYRKTIRNRTEEFIKQLNEVLGHNVVLKKDEPEKVIEENEEGEDHEI